MKQVSIEEIDRNLRVPRSVGDPGIVWADVREDPFTVYGLYDYRNQPEFKRLPDDIAQATNPGVAQLARNTAGGRVRFCTDSDVIAIHAEMPTVCRFPHMPLTGSAGFDLSVDDPDSGSSRFWRPFVPPVDMENGYESAVHFPSRRLRYVTIHFPSYSDVKTLLIGLRTGATLGQGLPYRNALPVVFYGSSITQGGCASRPGNSYQDIIAARMGMDYINLGFSGSGLAEDVIVSYMAGMPMCAFVSDYDHNAPSAEHLMKTHARMYRTIREAHPDIPYIMLSRYDFDCEYVQNVRRRDVIYETYREAWGAGDRNVYYIDGASVFRGVYEDLCTVDGIHPNDLGFALLADAIGAELRRALSQSLFL